MAIGIVTNVGAVSSHAGSTITSLTNRTLAVGEKLICAIQRGGGYGSVSGISFSAGAATCRADIVNSVVAGMEVWSCDVTTQIPSGSTVTVTFVNSSGDNDALTLDVVTGAASGAADKTSSSNAAGSTSCPAGTTAATTQAAELIYAAFAFSDQSAGSLSSVATGYTLGSSDATGGGRISTAYKIVAATGTQTATGTASGAVNSDNGIATYKEAAGATGVAPPITSKLQAVNTASGW